MSRMAKKVKLNIMEDSRVEEDLDFLRKLGSNYSMLEKTIESGGDVNNIKL
jgi:hypothetical protein